MLYYVLISQVEWREKKNKKHYLTQSTYFPLLVCLAEVINNFPHLKTHEY